MSENQTDASRIYDNPVPFMTVPGVFAYLKIDIIPFRDRGDHD